MDDSWRQSSDVCSAGVDLDSEIVSGMDICTEHLRVRNVISCIVFHIIFYMVEEIHVLRNHPV